MKTKTKIFIAIGVFFVCLLIAWAWCELSGSEYYNYKGYVVDIAEENGDTVIVTLYGNTESRFTIKWYTREKYKKDNKEIEVGDIVRLTTTRYSDANIKKMSVEHGYSTTGKLVYINELPDRPFILATDPTTKIKYLFDIIMLCGGDPFKNIEMGDTVKLYHSYPINSYTIAAQGEAVEGVLNDTSGLNEEDIDFIESKGYTVKK